MCLATAEKRQEPTTEQTKAYKIFKLTTGGLRFPHYNYRPSYDRSVNSGKLIEADDYDVWLHAKVLSSEWVDPTILMLPPQYPRGFHTFMFEKHAEEYADTEYYGEDVVIKEVLVKGVHTIGTQRGIPVQVSDHLMIPKISHEETVSAREEDEEDYD